MDRPDVQGHYDELAADYDEHWVYGPDYVPWMAGRIVEALQLTATDRAADIGCGTGLFAREVERLVGPELPIVCADPSESMLRQMGADGDSRLAPLRASAEDIASGSVELPYEQLDAIWLKESVHHVSDPAETLRGLAGLLATGGGLLVAMLPAAIEYPLFRAALQRFEELQPDPGHITGHLQSAGLDARLFHVEHQLRLDRDRYFGMVQARYMSVLSTFSDAEIEAGIDEMRAAHPEPVLTFPDRFAFVLGVKAGGGR